MRSTTGKSFRISLAFFGLNDPGQISGCLKSRMRIAGLAGWAGPSLGTRLFVYGVREFQGNTCPLAWWRGVENVTVAGWRKRRLCYRARPQERRRGAEPDLPGGVPLPPRLTLSSHLGSAP
jgi:hypothetical protein